MKLWEHETPKDVKSFFPSELKKMSEGKNISETSKKHWCHKPYKCDFGG